MWAKTKLKKQKVGNDSKSLLWVSKHKIWISNKVSNDNDDDTTFKEHDLQPVWYGSKQEQNSE